MCGLEEPLARVEHSYFRSQAWRTLCNIYQHSELIPSRYMQISLLFLSLYNEVL